MKGLGIIAWTFVLGLLFCRPLFWIMVVMYGIAAIIFVYRFTKTFIRDLKRQMYDFKRRF